MLLALGPALVPDPAWARAGRGGSFGSRGSLTFSPPPTTRTAPFGAAPIERSITPYGAPAYGGYGARPYGGMGMGRGGYFTSGLLGGFLGAGLAGLLLGRGFWGGMHGAGFLGFLLQLLVLYLVGRWLFRRFAGAPVLAQGPGGGAACPRAGWFARGGLFGGGGSFGSAGPGAGLRPIALTREDYRAFERALQAVQAAWSRQDIEALRALCTPEMVGYFGEQLADLASRGWRNEVRDVRLEQGDLVQAWTENGREYATVALRFSMVDVTYDAAGRVVEGSLSERATVTELWTFVRAPGGRWILSAIQQAR